MQDTTYIVLCDTEPAFELGQVLATPGAIETLARFAINPIILISRHLSCDWSEMDKDDQQANQEAVKNGTRIFSSYTIAENTKIWVITEADRSATTILLPSEY